MAVLLFSINNVEELTLQGQRNWSGLFAGNADLVDGLDGRDLRGGAAEENFVGNVEHFAGDHLFRYRDAKVLSQRDQGIARNSGQNGVAQRRRHQLAFAHDKNIRS